MNTRAFVAVTVVAGLLVGVAAWQLGRSSAPIVDDGPQPAQPVINENDPAASRSLQGRGTLAALGELRRPLECAVVLDHQRPELRSTGTVFLHNDQWRGDFIVPQENATVTLLTSMIIRDDALYVWTTIEGEAWGVKRSLTDASGLDAREPVRLTDEVQYTCTNWMAVDYSVFAPPSTVLFRDLGAAADAGMEYGTLFEDVTEPPTPN